MNFKAIVACPHCGTRNRIPAIVPDGKRVQCGRCKQGLDEPEPDDADDADAEDEALDIEGGQW